MRGLTDERGRAPLCTTSGPTVGLPAASMHSVPLQCSPSKYFARAALALPECKPAGCGGCQCAAILSLTNPLEDKLSGQIVYSVLVTIAGTLVAGIGDLSFDLKGYAMACTSCLLQSTYLLCVQKTGVENGIDSNTLLLYNSILSIPVLMIIVLLDGEYGSAVEKLAAGVTDVWFMVSVSHHLTPPRSGHTAVFRTRAIVN
ncbi:hypothetical protein CYMTET_35759 [Cymbomonas tetramitiformis]|uniref:Sugar phosphate transporter domain-containing protein n=1 Tax=Cymbomonas tetramitiformis TaxID=36881 RepID=A0AAE0KNC6_9CHLO|nr:hypothetical protein CYMTET_35759 [Cymbomonas tetramitiformis]